MHAHARIPRMPQPACVPGCVCVWPLGSNGKSARARARTHARKRNGLVAPLCLGMRCNAVRSTRTGGHCQPDRCLPYKTIERRSLTLAFPFLSSIIITIASSVSPLVVTYTQLPTTLILSCLTRQPIASNLSTLILFPSFAVIPYRPSILTHAYALSTVSVSIITNTSFDLTRLNNHARFFLVPITRYTLTVTLLTI